jgi:hypothetical protein
VLFALLAVAGFASTLALGSARGGILPTLSVPTLPVSLPVTTAPLPPAPPLPPPPPVPPAPPPALPPAPPPPALLPPPPPLPPAPPILQSRTPPPPPPPAVAGAAASGSPSSAASAPAPASEPSSRSAAAAAHVSRVRFHTRGPGRRGTTITFHLTAPATVVLLVRGPSPSCRLVGRKAVTLGKGVSRVRFLGRFHGRPLAPGTYEITMVARRGGASTNLGRLAIGVVPPGERIHRPSSKPVFAGCDEDVATASSKLFAGLGLVLPTAALKLEGVQAGPKATLRPPRLSVPVPKVPALPGSPGWGHALLAALFYGAVMLAGIGILLLVLGFAKERWNP